MARAGHIAGIVPNKHALLDRLSDAETLEEVKSVVAQLIETVGTYAYGHNEKTGETFLGCFALGGGGNMFFSNTDETGRILTLVDDGHRFSTEDRKAQLVEAREESARARRVAVGTKKD